MIDPTTPDDNDLAFLSIPQGATEEEATVILESFLSSGDQTCQIEVY